MINKKEKENELTNDRDVFQMLEKYGPTFVMLVGRVIARLARFVCRLERVKVRGGRVSRFQVGLRRRTDRFGRLERRGRRVASVRSGHVTLGLFHQIVSHRHLLVLVVAIVLAAMLQRALRTARR